VKVKTPSLPAPEAGITEVTAGKGPIYVPCQTVKLRPPIVTVALREAPSKLGETEYVTLLLPLPPEPELIVIHDGWLVIDHEQPGEAVTIMLPLPPAPGKLADSGLNAAAVVQVGAVTVRFVEAVTLPP